MMDLGSRSSTEDRFATVNGVRLHYRETAGAGGPLLCLHGLTSNARAWDALATELSPEYRVLAPDLRGRGDSDKPEGPYGQEAHVADAVALLDHLGIGRAVLLGHSLGAAVGLRLAAYHPDRVARLVLIDGGVSPSERMRESSRPFWERLTRGYPSWDAFLDAMRASGVWARWTAAVEGYFDGDAAVQPDGTVRHKTPFRVIERERAAIPERDLASLYPDVRCPTLLLRAPRPLRAEGDQMLSRERAESLAAALPNGRWREIPDTNHFSILIGHPPETTAAMREFLAE